MQISLVLREDLGRFEREEEVVVVWERSLKARLFDLTTTGLLLLAEEHDDRRDESSLGSRPPRSDERVVTADIMMDYFWGMISDIYCSVLLPDDKKPNSYATVLNGRNLQQKPPIRFNSSSDNKCRRIVEDFQELNHYSSENGRCNSVGFLGISHGLAGWLSFWLFLSIE